MIYQSRRRRIGTAIGAFLVVALVLSGVWLLARNRGDGAAQPPAAGPAAPSDENPAAQPGTSPGGPSTSTSATMTVTIFLHRGQLADPAEVVAVRRTVPRTAKVATAALQQLLAGPTATERRAGYWSHFSAATAGMLRSLQVSGGVARADFRDFRAIIPNAGSSAGSAALLAELDSTLKQFRTVRATVYSFKGDVAMFYEWLQLEPPAGTTPTLTEARRVARSFLTGVVGMADPVFAASRWRSDFIATVDFRSRVGEQSDRAFGPVTTVVLGKGTRSFTVLDATTGTIRVDQQKIAITPSDLQVVTSPVRVSGAVTKATAVRVAFTPQAS